MFGDYESSSSYCEVVSEWSADTPLPQFIFNLEEKSSRQRLMRPGRNDDGAANPWHRYDSATWVRILFCLPTGGVPFASVRCVGQQQSSILASHSLNN
jgi:hypothetical protein